MRLPESNSEERARVSKMELVRYRVLEGAASGRIINEMSDHSLMIRCEQSLDGIMQVYALAKRVRRSEDRMTNLITLLLNY